MRPLRYGPYSITAGTGVNVTVALQVVPDSNCAVQLEGATQKSDRAVLIVALVPLDKAF